MVVETDPMTTPTVLFASVVLALIYGGRLVFGGREPVQVGTEALCSPYKAGRDAEEFVVFKPNWSAGFVLCGVGNMKVGEDEILGTLKTSGNSPVGVALSDTGISSSS
jgi:hypothetical protein